VPTSWIRATGAGRIAVCKWHWREVTGLSAGPAGAIYDSSAERTAALPGWLTHHNFTRPHASPGHEPPGVRRYQLTNVPGELQLERARGGGAYSSRT
jgi:hypothetical protein